MTCSHTFSLGAYLLGALDPIERSAFESHAARCDDCRAELVRLAPLPGLLHRISAADFEDTPEVPADLRGAEEIAWYEEDPVAELPPVAVLPDVARVPDIDAPRRGRRLALMGAAAAMVVALSVGGVLVYESLRAEDRPGPVMVSWSATDPASGVRADVDLTDRAWGTEVKIRLHDVPPGKPCKLLVRGRDGYREVAGWWATSYGQGESIPGSTSIDLTRISRIQVLTDDDVVLVDVPPPS
ncbi:anti-sigma factor family protein [Actinokineospora globicatena]|uniref:RNA polymerase subunit sigma n=1 Tax=Actinokineospora globicatena TaxID=103729 RepID=A0A9W6QPE3_9PSEU|nr:zf-HC2 domain-containing protein [Actinokineospora globicatena]MCP2305564.1 putative zinc-finger [Actinokineospora globicatena]GLW81434.1 RNA polymerase subunit sigma [Actinokineospora globicatena]GLW87868.1 RNA polymerase subunit sigma [Actinokineospora globicatena]GLW94546.1 RNA polymerase subunit sigma [Actinokineospora globicatena]